MIDRFEFDEFKQLVLSQLGAVRAMAMKTINSRHAVALNALAALREPKDGINGKDGLQGPKGDHGRQGPKGDLGPMPRHRWDGTALQFEQGPDGNEWGKKVDLQGPAGAGGVGGVVMGGGGGTVVIPSYSYIPNGW